MPKILRQFSVLFWLLAFTLTLKRIKASVRNVGKISCLQRESSSFHDYIATEATENSLIAWGA